MENGDEELILKDITDFCKRLRICIMNLVEFYSNNDLETTNRVWYLLFLDETRVYYLQKIFFSQEINIFYYYCCKNYIIIYKNYYTYVSKIANLRFVSCDQSKVARLVIGHFSTNWKQYSMWLVVFWPITRLENWRTF